MHAALPKAEWVPDSSVTACEKCGKRFGQYRRKHHCRNCGHIFCWECSKLKYELLVPAKNGGHKKDPESLRVCDPCYDILQDKETGTSTLGGARPRASTIDAQRLDEREGRIAAVNAEAQAEEWCAVGGRRLEIPQRLPETGWRSAREKNFFVVKNEQKVEMMLTVLTLPDGTGLSVKSKSATTHFRSFLIELRHPFIAQTLDVGFSQSSPDLACGEVYLIRQFASSGSLRDRIHGSANPKHGCGKKYGKPGKPLREDKCAVLGKQILDGLEYLSELGKDLGELQMCAGLRASDVLLPTSNRACIADFENDLVGLEARPNGGNFAHTGPYAAALHAFSHIFFEMATGRELEANMFADPLSHIPVSAPAGVQQVLRELLQPEHGRKSTGEPLSPTRVKGMKLFSTIAYEKEVTAAIFDISSEHTKKQKKRLRRVFCAAEDKAKKVKRQEKKKQQQQQEQQQEAATEAEYAAAGGLAEPEPESEPEPQATDDSAPFDLPAAFAHKLPEINSMSTDIFALVVEAAKSSLDGGAHQLAAQAALPAIAARFQQEGLDPASAPTIHSGMRSLLKLASEHIASLAQEPGFDDDHGEDKIQVGMCDLLCPAGLEQRHVVSIVEALDDRDDASDDEDSDSPGQPNSEKTAEDPGGQDSSDSASDSASTADLHPKVDSGGKGSDDESIVPEPQPQTKAAPVSVDPIAEMQLRFMRESMQKSQSKSQSEPEPEPEPEAEPHAEPAPAPDSHMVAEESAPPGLTEGSAVPEGFPPARGSKTKKKKKNKKKKQKGTADTPNSSPATKVSDLFGSSSDDDVASTKKKKKKKKKKAADLFASSSDED